MDKLRRLVLEDRLKHWKVQRFFQKNQQKIIILNNQKKKKIKSKQKKKNKLNKRKKNQRILYNESAWSQKKQRNNMQIC